MLVCIILVPSTPLQDRCLLSSYDRELRFRSGSIIFAIAQNTKQWTGLLPGIKRETAMQNIALCLVTECMINRKSTSLTVQKLGF